MMVVADKAAGTERKRRPRFLLLMAVLLTLSAAPSSSRPPARHDAAVQPTGLSPKSAAAPLPGDLRFERCEGPGWQMLALGLATLASEDLTCIVAGLLIRRQELDAAVGVLGCCLGIYLGDLGLWLAGRVLGRRVLRWRPIAKRLPPAQVERWGAWFDRRGAVAVLASRFMPGTRLPVYVAAGIVGRRPWAFAGWTLVAVMLWTPLLVCGVALMGEGVVQPLERILGGGWLVLTVAALLLLALLRTVSLAWTEIGRARLVASVSRVWRWEFWPTWWFYLPLYPWIAWLAIRHRGLTVPTAANPGMPQGGVVGESKAEILARLPAEFVLPFALIAPDEPKQRLSALRSVLRQRGWCYPVILKPDSGERGASVRLVRDDAAALACLAKTPAPLLAQVYHPGPYEAGVFYTRRPDERHGRVFSITDKQFSFLVGDDEHTVEQLIWRHPRYRMQARRFLARLGEQADRVPAAGERLPLAMAGNHCQGTLFRDGSTLMTPALEAAIDRIARSFEGFYFGRFDLKYSDAGEFRAGRGFRIVELNGVTSESTNIYDPSWPIWRAYATLFRQWKILFEVGAANRDAGHAPTPVRILAGELTAHYRRRRLDPMAD